MNCYNLGEISCENTSNTIWGGGIMGYISGGYVNVNNCYNQASLNIASQDAKVGGIIGWIPNNNQQTRITNCATTITKAIGLNEATTANATITNVLGGQTNLPSVLSVVNTDREGVFIEDSQNTNNGYPILKWQMEHFNRNQ